jgi:hypothetical protein
MYKIPVLGSDIFDLMCMYKLIPKLVTKQHVLYCISNTKHVFVGYRK